MRESDKEIEEEVGVMFGGERNPKLRWWRVKKVMEGKEEEVEARKKKKNGEGRREGGFENKKGRGGRETMGAG